MNKNQKPLIAPIRQFFILLLCCMCLGAALNAATIHGIQNHGIVGSSTGLRVGQSFTSPSNGTITSISFVTSSTGSWNLYLGVDPGDGIKIPGAVYQTFNVTTGGVVSISLTTPFSITSGSVYRFEVQKTSGTSFSINVFHPSWAGSDYSGGHEVYDGMFFDGNHPQTTPSGQNLGTTTLLNDLDFGINYTVALPIELIDFKAEIFHNSVLLTWFTGSEFNNEKFEIQESRTGREFHKIGEISGNVTTTKQQEYSFDIENPINGRSYYRLKQIDFNGQFEYSKVVSVNFKGEGRQVGAIYPNPSKSGLVNLDYLSQNDDQVTVSIFDMTGKLMISQNLQVSNEENNLNFDFSDLITGIYIVKIGNDRNPILRKLFIEK
jgi:Secretion system C-terminal sorting domain